MACDEGILPLDERIADAADAAELDDIYETERRLLYVACSRAREHLLSPACARPPNTWSTFRRGVAGTARSAERSEARTRIRGNVVSMALVRESRCGLGFEPIPENARVCAARSTGNGLSKLARVVSGAVHRSSIASTTSGARSVRRSERAVARQDDAPAGNRAAEWDTHHVPPRAASTHLPGVPPSVRRPSFEGSSRSWWRDTPYAACR